jgi:hypothetical protein
VRVRVKLGKGERTYIFSLLFTREEASMQRRARLPIEETDRNWRVTSWQMKRSISAKLLFRAVAAKEGGAATVVQAGSQSLMSFSTATKLESSSFIISFSTSVYDIATEAGGWYDNGHVDCKEGVGGRSRLNEEIIAVVDGEKNVLAP